MTVRASTSIPRAALHRVFPKRYPSLDDADVESGCGDLSGVHRDSLVVNWWASFPAEPQRGVMI